MSEQEIIAEYIKSNFPEMLTTLDFVLFKTRVGLREAVERILSGKGCTNGDMVRKMSDEELSEFLMHSVHESDKEMEKTICGNSVHDAEDILAWLRKGTEG